VFLNLNPDQQIVADAVNGDYVCIAGPGSGKTATLIQRYMGMITKHGIPQKDILNLTFTNSAATEMVERTGMLDAKEIFRTFHSFALDLLQREREHVGFELCDTIIPVRGEQFQLIKDLMKLYPPITTFNSLKSKIEEWQSGNIDPDRAIEESHNLKGTEYFYAAAYRDYEKKSREQGWLDFHGLMKEAVKLLETNDEVRERNKRKYISVDECQDTDVVQFRLLQLIYNGNIFVVGDENQLIYEWRSAQSGNLSNFSRTFPGAKTLYLGQNYRSTQRLVAFFKRTIPVDNGLASHMVSMREEGVDPTITKFGDEIEEASIVLGCVTDPANTAIIARTNRQLMTVQKMAMARNLKSKILGRKNVWEQNEVRHLLELTKEQGSGFGDRPAHEVMKQLMETHNLAYVYRNSGSPMEKDPIENLNDIIKMSAKRGTVPEFLTWLRKLTFGAKSDKKPSLSLTTVHQAKGREWKHVFVIGVKQGLMPHKDGELLEEHRIFFVACSRAADTLDISFYGSPSQFLNDFSEEIEIYGEENS
jgi:DNA helicase-2/ATP-dependent DNA helicase PcrA